MPTKLISKVQRTPRTTITKSKLLAEQQRADIKKQTFARNTMDIRTLFAAIVRRNMNKFHDNEAKRWRLTIVTKALDAVLSGEYDYSPSTIGTVHDPHRFARRYHSDAKSPRMFCVCDCA